MRARRVLGLLGLALLVAFVVDLAYVAFTLRNRLTTASDHLSAMRTELETGNLDLAQQRLAAASDATSSAEGLLNHPAVAVVRVLPVVGRDTETLDRVVAAAELVTEAGEPGLQAAAILQYQNGTIGDAAYDDGRINLDLVSRAEPLVQRAQDSLDRAARELDAAERSLLPQVRSAVDKARAEIDDAASAASGAGALLRLLPRLAGGKGERTYLLAFQALGEARATGGVAGLFGVLHARDGKMELGQIAPYSRIGLREVAPDILPSWYVKTYGIQGALEEWPQANLSPNFPVDARVMLEMYRQAFDRTLEGVVAVDPVSLSLLMEGTGSFRVPGFDEKITARNVVSILSENAYVDFETRAEQNVFLAALVRTFWSRIEEGQIDASAFAHGVGEAVATQHLRVFSTNGADRRDLEDLSADGSLTPYGPNLQAVFNNNYSVNKVDYYLHRKIRTDIEIDDEGDLRVTTEVALRNDAPAGPASDLLGGIETDLPPGTNLMTLNFLMPSGARVGKLEVKGKGGGTILYRDSKHPIVWDLVRVPAGESAVAKLVYVVPKGATVDSEGGRFSFSFLPQPTVNVDELDLSVVPPAGYVLSGGGEGFLTQPRYVTERKLDTPWRLTLELERS